MPMRRLPQYPSRAMWAKSFLVAVIGLGLVEAVEIRHRDGIHRVEKVQAVVTAAPELHRRAPHTDCPADYQLCPESLQGGCCADGFACATDSCFATTQGPQTCDGRVGYYACGPDVGGGCCPEGSVCKRGSRCDPMSGVSYSHECSTGSYLCPAEVGYGCCREGMGCDKNRCFSIDPSTYVFTKTTTTTAADKMLTITTTITTVSTPTAPAETADAASDPALNKFYPSFVPKVDALVTKDNGGLTKPQIGGVVGGAVAFLIIILTISFFIIRHLNKVVKKVEETRGSSQSSSSRPQVLQFNKPTESDIDAMSVDPLMMSLRAQHAQHRRGGSYTDSATPYDWQSPDISSGNRGTPNSSNGYYAVPTSGGEREKHGSMDSSNNGGYFTDQLPPQPQRGSSQSMQRPGPGRTSSDSQGAYAPSGRLRSNTNETTSDVLSSGQQTPSELDSQPFVAELPATPASPADPSRQRSGGGSVPRPPLAHQRRGSGGAGHGRIDSAAGMGTPQLGVVAEQAEFQVSVHGHYGPPDRMVGQTSADYPNSSL